MKKTTFVLVLVSLLLLCLPLTASAAGGPTWSSEIFVANPNNSAVGFTLSLNPPTSIPLYTVLSYGTADLVFGSGGLPSYVNGSATIDSDMSVAAVFRQFPSGDVNYSPMLYSAFTGGDSSQTFYIPTFIKSATQNTKIGIQNVGDADTGSVTVTFYPSSGSSSYNLPISNIAKNTSYIIDTTKPTTLPTSLPASFDGSIVISGGLGKILAVSEETQTAGRRADAFEGSQGGTVAYMPSALCNYGTTKQTTYFAVQNVAPDPIYVLVDYFNESGARVGTIKVNSTALQPGRKVSFNACQLSGMSGRNGAAIIYALSISTYIKSGVTYNTTNAKTTCSLTTDPCQSDLVKIAVVGKVQSNDGLLTAYSGKSSGSVNVALPYVVWGASTYDNRSYIAIMNVGTAPATMTLEYYSPAGTKIVTQKMTVNPNTKGNSSPMAASALRSGSFNGSVFITSTQPIVVVVRTTKATKVSGYTTLGEDYSGVPYTK